MLHPAVNRTVTGIPGTSTRLMSMIDATRISVQVHPSFSYSGLKSQPIWNTGIVLLDFLKLFSRILLRKIPHTLDGDRAYDRRD
jgi:hypothetical protein